MKKFLIAMICMIFSTAVCADICPSVQSLKSSKENLWKAYDSDNHKPLSPPREARLRTEITRFSMAEWSQNQRRGSVHCYYNNANGSNLEAYFARNHTVAIKPSKYWYQVTGLMQCAAGPEKCEFQKLPAMQQQLASNEQR